MRIGFFTDSYRPYTSGVVRSIEIFTEQLEEMGHEVYIFAPRYPGFEGDVGRIYRFASVKSPTNRDFYLALPFSPHLFARIKKIGLDIIHVHSPFLLGALGARVAKRLNLPLVYTYHTLYDRYIHYVPVAHNTAGKAVMKFCVNFCNSCDMVLVPTDAVGKYLQQAGVRAYLECLPTGVRALATNGADMGFLKERYHINGNNRVCLFVGRLGREKNLDFLLRAFALINVRLPETVLVVVGGGPEEEALRNMVQKLGIENKVIFTGLLSFEDTVKCYAGADVFVFPSLTETQGLVIGEAKVNGLPVVAVRAFGTIDMVNDGVDGFLVDADEVEFAGSVLRLLTDKNLRITMGNRARETVRDLDVVNLSRRLEKMYQQLMVPDKMVNHKKP